jgi:hypothetical protein
MKSQQPQTVTIPVTTTQIAPTILKALGLDPQALQSVQEEDTETLPRVFGSDQNFESNSF